MTPIVPDWPAPPGVSALVTTRQGGVSTGAYASFNLAAHVGDDPVSVRRNREILRAALPSEPVWLDQRHTATVADAEAGPCGVADASVSRTPGTVCAVLTADCLPVLLCDEAGSWVAAAHAGWRGLAAGIVEATVARSPALPARLIAWLGPAIGPRRYEVGDDVRAAFVRGDPAATDAFAPSPGGRWMADLYALARRRLAAAGVRRVHGGELCTASDAGRFYSFRRDGVTGRMATLIWLERG
jgi:polyphenol oxidase